MLTVDESDDRSLYKDSDVPSVVHYTTDTYNAIQTKYFVPLTRTADSLERSSPSSKLASFSMNTNRAKPLVPTFTGFVQNTTDALILFEACMSRKLHHVPRRPHDRERSQLIQSGNIFIYEEKESGIKRWTDGVAWSPSRILGDFLIYRELDKPFPPGEKKRAIKRKRSSLPGVDGFQRADFDSQENVEMPRPLTPPEPPANPEIKSGLPSSEQDKELERSLIGPLVDSYGFRAHGLVKKTMSISVNGTSYHMVSYYKVDDVKQNALARPLQDPRIQHISVRPELYLKQNFRAPIKETEHYAIGGQAYAHPRMMYSMAVNAQNMRPVQYYAAGQYPGMYSPMATSNAGHAAMYSTITGTQWAQQPATTYAGHPSYTAASSYGGYYRSGSQSDAKHAESHASSQPLGYSSSYPASYTGVQRDGSRSPSGRMPQSSHQTPVQLGWSTFGSMSAPTGRPSYSGPSDPSPTSDGESHQMYSASQGPQSLPSQQYAVRSPSQSYGMQGAPQSSATQQSPHTTMKSPHPAAPASSTPVQSMSHDPHCSSSYAATYLAHPSSDMNGLGISGGASHSHSYSFSDQDFRPVGAVAATQAAGGRYSQ